MFRHLSYYFSQLWINISRNFLMSTAAISTSFFSQLIFGCIIILISNINHVSDEFWSQTEIRAFVDHSVPKNTVDAMSVQIKKQKPQIDTIRVLSPEEAMSDLEKQLGISLWDREEENPLPWTLVIKVYDPDQVQNVADYLLIDMKFEKEDVKYPAKAVQKINSLSKAIKIGGYILTVLMAGLTLFIIMNTIRLTVIARRTEIRTMQLVGATSWFIRWPFLMEGIIIGLIGSVVSTILLAVFYYFLYGVMTSFLDFMPKPIEMVEMMKSLVLILFLSGFCMGLLGSYLSVRRFLEEETS